MPHKGYATSFSNALEAIKLLKDPETAASRCGTGFTEKGFELTYFGDPCTVSFPGCEFSLEQLALGDKILILHYLSSDGPLEESTELTTFQSLPGGMFYQAPYRKRGPDRVLAQFGNQPDTLAKIAMLKGWRTGEVGDVSVILPVLPRITVEIAIYEGDDEFPPEVKFLFRKDILSLLPLEDVAVLATNVATRLAIEASRNG